MGWLNNELYEMDVKIDSFQSEQLLQLTDDSTLLAEDNVIK